MKGFPYCFLRPWSRSVPGAPLDLILQGFCALFQPVATSCPDLPPSFLCGRREGKCEIQVSQSVRQSVSQLVSETLWSSPVSQSASQSISQSVSQFGASAGLCELHEFNEVVRRFVALPASWFLSKSWKFLEAPEDIFVKKNDGLQWHLEFPCWGTPPQNTPFGIYYVNLFQRHTRRFPLCADHCYTGFYRLKWHITPFSFICKLLFFVFAIQLNPIFVDWADNIALMMISLFPALRLALRGHFCSSSLLSWVSHSVSQPASQSVSQSISEPAVWGVVLMSAIRSDFSHFRRKQHHCFWTKKGVDYS